GLCAVPSVLFLSPEGFSLLFLSLCAVAAAFLAVALFLRRGMTSRDALSFAGRALAWKPHLLTIANWTVYYAQLTLIARAFGIMVPLLPFLGIMTLAGVVNLLAIAPAGLGTR